MSGLELAAVAAMGAMYFDSRYNFVSDMYNVRNLLHATLTYRLAERKSNLNLIHVFNYWVKKQPNHDFLVYPEPVIEADPTSGKPLETKFIVKRYTYGEVSEIVQRYSKYLTEVYNIKPHDVVGLDFVNKPEFVFIWLALWNLGAIPAMINYNLQGKSLIHCVVVSTAKLLIVDDEVKESGLAVQQQLRSQHNIETVIVDQEHFNHVIDNYSPMATVNVPATGKEPSCFIFTSGTTGLPKAANFSWKKAYWGALLYGNVSFYSKNDILYSAMPLYHSTAAALGFMATLHKGGTYAIGHKFSTTTFWLQARLCKATAIQYVGETGRYLLNSPESPDDKNHHVKVAHGNGMRPDVWQKFKDRFNVPVISEFYGATEFPSAINNLQYGGYGVGACGSYGAIATAVLKRSKWQIVAIDPESQDIYRDPKTQFARPTKPNEAGEFLFKVDARNISGDFQGYAGNTKASNEKLIYDVFKKGDAYVRTGDLLKYNENNQIFFVDRLGDTFRWKSENVSTNEVEGVISELDNVDVCVCVGIKVPRHEGRAGFAVIKLSDPEKKFDMQKLGKTLLSELPRYAVPVFVKFVGEVQATGNNKIQKKQFREQQIPAPKGEELWWLVGSEYRKLTPEAWARVEQGHHKL